MPTFEHGLNSFLLSLCGHVGTDPAPSLMKCHASSVFPLSPCCWPAARTVQILENPGTEYPTMCMLLQSDGNLLLRGGFAFYSPGAWRRDPQDGATLIITLGGSAPFPVDI